MAIEHKTGIPTLYRGVQYRSRLEARWAAFFDLLRWPYQYEPFDLDGWIPDFMLLGSSKVLVEVKPVVEFPKDIAAEIDRTSWTGEALIVGCSLLAEGVYDNDVQLGWSGEWFDPTESLDGKGGRGWSEAVFYGQHEGSIGFTNAEYSWFDRVINQGFTGKDGLGHGLGPIITPLWNQAGNLVQWRGKQSVVVS